MRAVPFVVKVVTHYREDDFDCSGDHGGGEILVDGNVVEEFYDSYHDSRSFQDGFVAGVKYICESLAWPVEVIKENVADQQW